MPEDLRNPSTPEKQGISPDPQPARWALAMSCEQEFRKEREKMGQVWTLLGYLEDLPNINDWLRTTLGGRSVFVQRFKEGVRGFENMCVHRFHPIHNEDRGNGPVLCAFHHWSYDQEGRARGIPKCREMYGTTADGIDARLRPLELEICGGLIFGRFGAGESLREWLGKSFDILAGLTANRPSSGRLDFLCKAHWKLIFNISAEEYHIVAIHPGSFGKGGHLPDERVTYYRFGAHSAYFFDGKTGELDNFAAEATSGRVSSWRHYRVLHIFPGITVAMLNAVTILGDRHAYLIIMHLVPEARDQTRIMLRHFPLPFERPAGPARRLLRRLLRPFLAAGIRHQAGKIVREDNLACERMQQIAHQVNGNPLLSVQEERVGWIEEEYARIMGYAYPDNGDKPAPEQACSTT